MASQLTKAFMTPDGKAFPTAAEANDYMRAPQVKAALLKVSGGDQNLAAFLLDQEDEIQKAFEVGVVSRVTKSERNKLRKALDHMATIQDLKLRFLQDNMEAILESFRWPSVKRMDEAQKAAATMESLTKLADENAAKWIVKNKDNILGAYNAGVEKRVASPKAMEALDKARKLRAEELAKKKAA